MIYKKKKTSLLEVIGCTRNWNSITRKIYCELNLKKYMVDLDSTSARFFKMRFFPYFFLQGRTITSEPLLVYLEPDRQGQIRSCRLYFVQKSNPK